MKKKLLLMSLATAALLAGCSKEPLSEGDDNSLKGQIVAKAFSNKSIGVGTRAPFLGTTLGGEVADVYALTQTLGSYSSGATMFTDAYGRGTMSFNDTEYVGFDAGAIGSSQLPTNTDPIYLYGFYPKGWELGKKNGDAATEALLHSFDGKTDLMSTYLKAGDDVKVAYNNAGVAPEKADLLFKHLLTCYHIQVKGESADAIASWGVLKSIALKEAGAASNMVEIQKDDHVKYYNNSAKGAPAFYKLTGTSGALTYTDNLYGGTDASTSQVLTDVYANACYSMVAPVTVDADKASPEITLAVVTLLNGKEKTTEVPVSLNQDKFKANANSTCGYSIKLALNFRAGSIQALSTVEEWKDGGNLDENMDNTNRLRINLSENGTANCYVVTKASKGGYSFDATVRGNGYEKTDDPNVSGINYGTLPDLATAKEARIIWQTDGTEAVIKTVKLSADKKRVEFTLGTATEGNAVIGLFASSAAEAPCLWSWHIWRVNGALPADVDCTKDPSPVSASKDFKMMALNLGAFNNATGDVKSIGLMYQWGRKDPFPGPKLFSNAEPTNIYGSVSNNGTAVSLTGNYTLPKIASTSGIGTEAWAVQYPGVLIYNRSTPYDWMVTKNDALWGTPWVAGGVNGYNGNQGVKSIYDPCPVGYRVPPQDTWNQAVKDGFTNGWAFTGIVSSGSFWFPAAGLRNGTYAGELAGVTLNGGYWSSSPHGEIPERGGRLYFYRSGSVNPRDGSCRAEGCSVRCVAE